MEVSNINCRQQAFTPKVVIGMIAFVSVSDYISSVLTALVIPLLLLVKRFFEVPQENEQVPVENVNEVETKNP